MTVKELIDALSEFECNDNEVIGFLEGKGDFKLKAIKYIQSNGEPFIVITSEDFNPFKSHISTTPDRPPVLRTIFTMGGE